MRRAVAVLALLLTAACGTRVRYVAQPTPTPTPTPTPSASASASASPTPGASDPGRLLGWWRLTYPSYGWSVGFGEQLTVVAPCGDLHAAWSASPTGLFSPSEIGGATACLQKAPRPDTSWYTTPRSFALGDELVLLKPDGTVAARLVRSTAPAGRRTAPLLPQHRALMADPAPLPPGVVPAVRSQLAGRWVGRAAEAGNGRGYVDFGSGWDWRGSNGCNGYRGGFSVGAAGEFLATAGVTTAVSCDTTPAPAWVLKARRVGVQQGALVLADVSGTVLGRLWRS